MLLQFLINGLVTGLLYTLTSLGFALVYNTTRIFHIAFAVLYVTAAYLFWQLSIVWHIPVVIAIIISSLITGLISLTIERWIYFPLFKSKASLNILLIGSIGVFIVLTNIIALCWGNETKIFSSEIGTVNTAGSLIITGKQTAQLCTAAGLVIIFFIFLNRSRTGLHIKALRDDPELYQLLGFSIPAIRSIIFFASGMLVAVSSCMLAWDIGMSPHAGMPLLISAIVALIIGGIGRFESCIIGGIALGILQALIVWKWSVQWQDAITFVILLLFLFFRPQGFIGEKSRIV